MQEFEECFKKWGNYLRLFMSDKELLFCQKWARAFLYKHLSNWDISKLPYEEIDTYHEWDINLQKRLGSSGTKPLTHITYAEYLRDTVFQDELSRLFNYISTP